MFCDPDTDDVSQAQPSIKQNKNCFYRTYFLKKLNIKKEQNDEKQLSAS